jgi:alpha-tubulin suppressor-like RCC1 family protein
VKQISAGKTHFAAITTTDQLYVWGSNEHGQLGLKDKVVRKTPTTSANFNGLQVTKVSCGDDFTFVITQCNEILVTGKLPFAIEQADGTTANCVTSFQPIA